MIDAPEVCRRCKRPFAEGEAPDPHGWCQRCFREVVRASTGIAVLPGIVVGLLYGWLLLHFGLTESRFVIVFLALGAVLAWLAFKVARRVAFDVIRSRARRRS